MANYIDKRLQYFYQVIQHGGVRAAADVLGVAPSVISRQVTTLERQLGTQLIDRSLKGAIPTPAGQEVLLCYKALRDQENILKEKIAAMHGFAAGSITLSIGAGYVEPLSMVIAQFSARYPNIGLQVDINSSKQIERKVLENDAQIGVIYNPMNHKNIRVHYEMQHRLCVFMAKDSPLTQYQTLGADELRGQRLALTDTTHGIRQLLEYAEQKAKVSLSATLICNDMNLLKNYVKAGGVTLLPEFMYDSADQASIQVRPFVAHDMTLAKTQIISRGGRALPKAASLLIKWMAQALGSASEQIHSSITQT